MIRIHIEEQRVTAKGHALFAEKGRDIVCAAVSALVYTLAERLCERGMGAVLLQIPQRDGGELTEVHWQGDAGETLECFRCGVELIERQYPMCVTVRQ